MKRFGIAFLVLILCPWLSACYSPETSRTRGGGPGADVGNRRPFINMHEGSRPFYQTPQLIPVKPPPLDSAHQADELSRK
jgi:hypothetical protein